MKHTYSWAGKIPAISTCPLGKTVRLKNDKLGPEGLGPGPCQGVCGSPEILHSTFPHEMRCMCSWWRNGLRLCRQCAFDYDVFTRHRTRMLHMAPIDSRVVRAVMEAFERGQRIEETGRDEHGT